MSVCRSVCKSLLIIFALTFFSAGAMAQETINPTAPAKSTQGSSDDADGNLDTHLYLLVGTNQDVDAARIPAVLDPVMKELRASLPFKNYRLAATLINRVRNDGRLNLNWIGGPLMGATPSATTSNITPTFNTFTINNVKLVADASGQSLVRMSGFSFGARIPIQTATLVADNAPAGPVINYQHTGLSTDMSMREGRPVIVGTLNVGPSGDAIILVMSARQANK